MSAIDDTELLHGGCAILWESNLKLITSPLNCPNERICAVKVISANAGDEFALFCVYMPVDTRHDRENLAVFDNVLSEIVGVCEAESFDSILVVISTPILRAISRCTRSHYYALHRK